jgi:hypothetical protein
MALSLDIDTLLLRSNAFGKIRPAMSSITYVVSSQAVVVVGTRFWWCCER